MSGAMAATLKKHCKGFTFNWALEFLRRLIWESYPKISEEDEDSCRALGQLLYLVFKNRLKDLVEDSDLGEATKQLIIEESEQFASSKIKACADDRSYLEASFAFNIGLT